MPQRPPQRAPWPPFPSFSPDGGGVVEGASPEVNTKQRRRTKKEGFLLARSSALLSPCLTEGLASRRRRRRRRAMVDVFSGRLLLDRRGAAVEAEQALENKVVGLYFSAAWCSLCREFTPLLADFHAELVGAREAPFQVVFVSSDRSPEEMAASLRDSHGDWLALPFHDPLRHELKKKYNITAIPKLVIVKQTGEVITDKGRKQIRERGLNCFRNWLEAADVFQNFCS